MGFIVSFTYKKLMIFYVRKLSKLFKSLNLKLKDGTIFKLGGGFSNKDRENPPKIGSYVTFKYYGLTKNNKPKFASFLRVREKE